MSEMKKMNIRNHIDTIVWLMFFIQVLFIIAAFLASWDVLNVLNDDPDVDIPSSFRLSTILTFIAFGAIAYGLANQVVDDERSSLARVFAFVYYVLFTFVIYFAATDPGLISILDLALGGFY